MLKILKWYLIISVVFAISWPFSSKYLPDNVQKSNFAVAANFVTDKALSLTSYRNNFVTLNKHSLKIIQANANVFRNIADKITNNKIKTVMYFYNPERFVDRIGFNTINNLAVDYAKLKNIAIIPIAVTDDRAKINAFLDYIPRINTSIVFLPTTEVTNAMASLNNIVLDLSKSPNIIYIEPSGKISGEGLSLKFEENINTFLRK
jgi:hypothetical protein